MKSSSRTATSAASKIAAGVSHYYLLLLVPYHCRAAAFSVI